MVLCVLSLVICWSQSVYYAGPFWRRRATLGVSPGPKSSRLAYWPNHALTQETRVISYNKTTRQLHNIYPELCNSNFICAIFDYEPTWGVVMHAFQIYRVRCFAWVNQIAVHWSTTRVNLMLHTVLLPHVLEDTVAFLKVHCSSAHNCLAEEIPTSAVQCIHLCWCTAGEAQAECRRSTHHLLEGRALLVSSD